ncbi:unnamed protein product, partial [marine sediment metagenome]
LREDILDIVQYAHKKEFALRLFTNGTLIDEEAADRIKELHPLAVEISLYGMEAAVHEAVTGVPGSFSRTTDACRLLADRNIRTVVKSTVMKVNMFQFDKIKDFADSIGAEFRFSLKIMSKIDGSDGPRQLQPTEKEMEEFLAAGDWLPREIRKKSRLSLLCAAGINAAYISPYGDVFPCVNLREYCGNIRENSFAEVWRGAAGFKKLRDIKPEDLRACFECGDLVRYCYRCPGLSLQEEGDLLACSQANDRRMARVVKQVMEQRSPEPSIKN